MNKPLKNCTVKELIEILKDCEQDAIICHTLFESEESSFHSTFEVIKQVSNAMYIDDSGNESVGTVITLF